MNMIAPTLHAELMARAAAYEAEVAGALEGWRREQRDRWDHVRGRVEALTMQIRVALIEQRRRAQQAPPSRRQELGQVMRWLSRLDGERHKLEREIWAELGAARRDDTRWRAAVEHKAAELHELGRRLARELDGAVAEATAGATTRVADTGAGRALGRELGSARELLARRLAAMGTAIEADLGRLAGRGFPDMGEVLRRFDAAMAGRLGGDGAAPARARVVVARRPAGPPRKKARVPRFILSKFYRPGGLRKAGDGVEITFTNPLGFCIIQGGDAVVVDGRPFPKEETLLDNGERRVNGQELSDAAYLKFPKGGEIRVTLRGLALPPGPHRLMCALELRKMGWVELDVKDQVQT